MMAGQKFNSIDEYLESVPPVSKSILQEIRKRIRTKIPRAIETISYQLPVFKLKRTFIYFAAFKEHIGVYPPVKADGDLAGALDPYFGLKGNLKFPLNQPIPYELIEQVAIKLAQQYDSGL